jgi:ketosteroid isomerase-like protein
MRTTLSLLVALCLSVGNRGADQPKLNPAQQEVLGVSSAMTTAIERRDLAAWAGYVADDCIFSDDDGNLSTKAKLLEGFRKNWPVEYDHGPKRREFVVHVYGDTTVMNFRVTDHEQFTHSDIVTEMRITETWGKRNGFWQMIARHWGPLPVNFHRPITVDTSVYADCVGHYQWRPLDFVESVIVKNGKLLSQVDNEEDEYLPLAPDAFFLKDDLGSITFDRDTQGRVTGYTYHRNDGQEIHVKKIK